MNKLVVPMALGLSIVTVTAVVVYYVFKKDDDEEVGGNKKIKTSRINLIEVKVPKAIVPALIGRAGSNIKDIERKSGALIHFNKFTDADYDVCVIRGRIAATQLAETMVHDFIKQQPVVFEDTITVPSWACGRIIGSGGVTINDISHRSGARVKVDGLPTDKVSHRLITIKGTKKQIQIAKELIENSVAQEKCRREIEQSKSPRTAPRSASGSPRALTRAGHSPDLDRGDTDDQGDPDIPLSTSTPHSHAKYKLPETTNPSIEVYVSAVSSPSRFWVQFVGPQVAQLDELVAQMTDYYNNMENRELHALREVVVGQLVAAVFRHDGRWYRARVHDLRPNEFDATQQVADVFFVDYGDSEYVSVHELCELRADLLGLRFQAMECFLAGVRPAVAGAGAGEDVGAEDAHKWDRWPAPAIERFEELTEVARWKPLVSRTCTYKQTATAEGEKEKEIPGIKLYHVTDDGELDIGEVLIDEGLAVAGAPVDHTTRPAPAPDTPFGDLGNSRVLGMLTGSGGARCSSLPKDHKDDRNERIHTHDQHYNKEDGMTTSKSLASLQKSDQPLSISNFELSYPDKKSQLNGSHENFLNTERSNLDKETNASSETLTPNSITKIQREEAKANMNRIDSHHGNLEALGRSTHDLH